MPELIRIYWRDIPSQVIAKAGRRSAKVMLPDRFQQAIDRAAMRAGKGGSEAYMEDWRRERGPCGEALHEEAERAVAALVDAFDEATLERVVKAKGVAEGVTDDDRGVAGRPADAPNGASTETLASAPADDAAAANALEDAPTTDAVSGAADDAPAR